jgi:hypothetical protein
MIAENEGICGGTGRTFDLKYIYNSIPYVTFLGSHPVRQTLLSFDRKSPHKAKKCDIS